VAESLTPLKAILETIRDDAQRALTLLGHSEEQRSLRLELHGVWAREAFHPVSSARGRTTVSKMRWELIRTLLR
jgi:hypothetical protein